MIKAIIFDCDGVLVDSQEAIIANYQTILPIAGYPKPTREEAIACFHLTLRNSLIQLSGATDPAEIERLMTIAVSPEVRNPEMFAFPPHLKTILTELKQTYALGIATSRLQTGIDEVMSKTDIRELFDAIVVHEDYTNPKPHPEPLLIAAERLGIQPSEAIYIGDMHTDIEAAQAAGMKNIHLAPEKHNDADVGITAFDQIPAAIEQLVS